MLCGLHPCVGIPTTWYREGTQRSQLTGPMAKKGHPKANQSFPFLHPPAPLLVWQPRDISKEIQKTQRGVSKTASKGGNKDGLTGGPRESAVTSVHPAPTPGPVLSSPFSAAMTKVQEGHGTARPEQRGEARISQIRVLLVQTLGPHEPLLIPRMRSGPLERALRLTGLMEGMGEQGGHLQMHAGPHCLTASSPPGQ